MLRNMTSFGTDLADDDMILQAHEDDENYIGKTTITSGGSGKPGEKPAEKKPLLGKDWATYMLIKSRFEDPSKNLDKKTIWKRKEDFGKDLNLNLLTGKIAKATYYFDPKRDEETGEE